MPSRARACLPPAPCVPPSTTMPPDGAVDVPLNVEVEAVRTSESAATPVVVVTLRVARTGFVVPLVEARTPRRFRPESPLAPNTRYELLAPLNVPRDPWGPTCLDTPTVVATFTTGTGTDTTAPSGLTASAGGCSTAACDQEACCGPYDAVIARAVWDATDDGGLPVSFAFGSPDGPRTYARGGSAASLRSGSSGADPLVMAVPLPGGGPVFAIDAAGNVSLESAPFTLNFSCGYPTPDVDAGVDLDGGGLLGGDSGLGDSGLEGGARCDGAVCPPAVPAPGGCGVAPGTSSSGTFGALLLSLVALAARRRSRAGALP